MVHLQSRGVRACGGQFLPAFLFQIKKPLAGLYKLLRGGLYISRHPGHCANFSAGKIWRSFQDEVITYFAQHPEVTL